LAGIGDTLVSTFRCRTSAHVGDARSDPQLRRDVVEALELEEFACVPLEAPGEPLGVMLADNKYSGVPIERHQVELLEMFARHASLGIANALAYMRIENQLSELRRTRDQLIEAERMASVGRMAGHLAHEIRNPLTSIGGFARSIAREHQENARTHRNAMIIFNEVRRLERALANVLDFTRPLRPTKRAVQLNGILEDTLGQFTDQMEANSVQLHLSLAPELPEISADGEMIKQVIINLLKNALEAMRGAPDRHLTVTTACSGDSVVLTVGDTGGGMDPDTIDQLFSPFYTTKIGGVGLGLSVSRRIIRQHGGDIEIHSEPGVGSTFTITLATNEPTPERRASREDDTGRGDDG
jgi:signal transduction histidine kinase